ncbi:calcium-binding protein [Novosphingobium sp. PASSN1]|uniref:calcium-binding protein n=1 Tax=Novosphingobium sp. PASSN1 TaxID=2015561 RepID=UPI000BC45898|nr:calcium-binding protein [Novosphingobium sp. PASSN1]OYU34584.1 MAG: hypothetical protein CFE35_14475 [Novosphingobium sp. PASSN1]
MPLRIATNQTTTGITYNLGTLDNLYVPVRVSSVSTGDNSVLGSGGGHKVVVSGNLFGAHIGIELGSAQTDSGNSVLVNAGGSVDGFDNGINLSAKNGRITNHGSISSVGSAIVVGGELNTTDKIVIANFGTIAGYNGIFFASGTGVINNFGVISSDPNNTAIFTDAGDDIVRNHGNIAGTVRLFSGNDKLINRGTIVGDVKLEANNDVLDNRGGLIDGQIDMGSGDDRFRPGSNADFADGGAGIDTLDFSDAGSIKVALDGSFAFTGVAIGDSYAQFENILGSRTETNTLVGDENDNALIGGGDKDTLSGLGGADRLISGFGNDILLGGSEDDLLNGGDGADRLTGGSGEDTLTGGGGADLFLFGPGDFSGITRNTSDYIADFSRASGDKINLAAVDAKAGTATNDAFTFIGTAAFQNVAGELRISFVETSPGFFDTLILGDTNGDGTADFGITLASQITLLATDFVL